MVFACYQSQLSMREMRDQGYLSTDSGACPVRPSLPQACSADGTCTADAGASARGGARPRHLHGFSTAFLQFFRAFLELL